MEGINFIDSQLPFKVLITQDEEKIVIYTKEIQEIVKELDKLKSFNTSLITRIEGLKKKVFFPKEESVADIKAKIYNSALTDVLNEIKNHGL